MVIQKRKMTKKQLKEDKLVTYIFTVRNYFEENWKRIAGAAVGVFVIVALVMVYMNSKKKAAFDASYQLSVAEVKYINGDYASAIPDLQTVTNNFSGTPSAGVAVFYLANAYFFTKDYENAEKYFKEYIDDYGDDEDLLCSSYAGLGAVFEDRNNYPEAAGYYEEGALKLPDNFQVPKCKLGAARCYKLAGNKEKAEEILKKLVEEYPNSAEVRDANILLASLK
ncbi:tetratricopeptide repeat protein [candidate division KSB1 bacterium]